MKDSGGLHHQLHIPPGSANTLQNCCCLASKGSLDISTSTQRRPYNNHDLGFNRSKQTQQAIHPLPLPLTRSLRQKTCQYKEKISKVRLRVTSPQLKILLVQEAQSNAIGMGTIIFWLMALDSVHQTGGIPETGAALNNRIQRPSPVRSFP